MLRGLLKSVQPTNVNFSAVSQLTFYLASLQNVYLEVFRKFMFSGSVCSCVHIRFVEKLLTTTFDCYYKKSVSMKCMRTLFVVRANSYRKHYLLVAQMFAGLTNG